MKILHFTHCFFPIYGGTTTRLYNLLSEGINEQYLYVPQAPSGYIPDSIGVLKEEEDFGNIKVRRCKLVEKKDFTVKIPVINTFRYIKINSDRLVNFVKEEDIEIVHGHNPSEFAAAAMKYVKKNNIPFVYEIHTLSHYEQIIRRRYIPNLAYSLVQKLFISKEKRICQSADAFIVSTNAMKQKLINTFGVDAKKIAIIPNGVDERTFDPVKWHQKGEDLRKEKKWANKIIFMYNGRFDYESGIEFFLNTLSELPIDFKRKIKVVLMGRGPLQSDVESMSRKEKNLIEYLGLVNYRDMAAYYSACGVHVIPWRSTLTGESCVPTKLLEGMAMEKIVLGSDVGGITEVLTNNKSGITFQKENKDDLLKKICYIVENIDNMDNIRKQARKDVIEKYSWEKSRERLQNVYENFLSGSTTYREG